jgi:Heterokaryon incompatibility protein (HET)
MSKTVQVNLAERLKKGSLGHNLPATLEDAMLLVKDLGERYLWIDTLCIIQDDAQSKHRNIRQMGLVYSRAFATIVGLHGRMPTMTYLESGRERVLLRRL